MKKMLKEHKKTFILSSVVIFLPIIIGLLLWKQLPEQMVTHWNARGEADGWSGRSFTIFGLPCIMFALHWLCILLTGLDSKAKEQNSKVLHMVFWIMPITSILVSCLTYTVGLGMDINPGVIVILLLSLSFIIMGNYMPKCTPNHSIGVRTRFTLRNNENWTKTHRFAGRIWVLGGLLILPTMFLSVENFMYITLPVIMVIALAPGLYSYIYYKKQLKAGTTTKEENVLTPSEKKTNFIATIIGLTVLGIAMVFLFTGKFTIIYEETSFSIDAPYWDDASIAYADIDNIEYREQDDPDASMKRAFGYGSFNVLMGEFESDEFGNYTRYSYTACDSCVVLTVGKKTMVVNGKDDNETQAIYKQLSEKMNQLRPHFP